jgi:hypothetical protein
MAATDADPWTFVKPRSRKNKGKQASSKPPPGSQTSSESPAVFKPRTTNLRSVDEISVEYRAVRAEWLESDTCAKLRELVEKHASGNVSISKAICLGVGTFDPEDGAWAQKRISFHQLIAFTVMVEELGASPWWPTTIMRDLKGELTHAYRKEARDQDTVYLTGPYIHRVGQGFPQHVRSPSSRVAVSLCRD